MSFVRNSTTRKSGGRSSDGNENKRMAVDRAVNNKRSNSADASYEVGFLRSFR